MIAELAIASILMAAADPGGQDDRSSRFSLLRGLGDLDGAYEALLQGMEAIDKIGLLVQLGKWVQDSSGLVELRDRLTEYQSAFLAVWGFETRASGIQQQWPLEIQFRSAFVPGESGFGMGDRNEGGLPWFCSDPDLSMTGDGGVLFNVPGRVFYQTLQGRGRRRRLGRSDQVSLVNEGGSVSIWSADDQNLLVGQASSKSWIDPGFVRRLRVTYRFFILPHDGIVIP